MDQLKVLRRKINQLDKQLVKLVAKRFSMTRTIQAIKRQNKMSVKQTLREEEILKRQIKRGEQIGLKKSFIQNLYQIIFRYSRKG